MFTHMYNRKVHVEIIPHCGIYVTVIMRVQECTESEKACIMEKTKELYEIAERYKGEIYDLPVFTPIDLGEVVFHNTFVFPNGELSEKYEEVISHI